MFGYITELSKVEIDESKTQEFDIEGLPWPPYLLLIVMLSLASSARP